MTTVTDVPAPGLAEKEADVTTGGGIQCPKCHWKPSPKDRWVCTCEHSWNTFDTRGRCPNCGKRWLDTQCLNCAGWSLHDAWYIDQSASFPA